MQLNKYVLKKYMIHQFKLKHPTVYTIFVLIFSLQSLAHHLLRDQSTLSSLGNYNCTFNK